jgi:hypothetical protein
MELYKTLKSTNLSVIISNYIKLLIKCEILHNKLESLYQKATSKAKSIKNSILKINTAINKLMVEIMEYQWLIELLLPNIA